MKKYRRLLNVITRPFAAALTSALGVLMPGVFVFGVRFTEQEGTLVVVAAALAAIASASTALHTARRAGH